MNKDDAIAIMMNSINSDNLKMCLDSGMSEDEAAHNVNQSQHSLIFMMNNIYDKLVEAKVIN